MNKSVRYLKIKEVYDLSESTIESYSVKKILDSIYDDFENRICENCKYYDSLNKSSGMCANISIQFVDAVDSNFGCNGWELKNDN